MRDTNRGVVHTQPNGKQQSAADFAVSIDWLEFTVCGVDRDVVAIYRTYEKYLGRE